MNNSIVSFFANNLGFEATSLQAFLIFAFACFIVVNVCAVIGGLGTYAERKISADLQMRQGPNRVGPFGILQFLADGVKMLLKEVVIPTQSDKFLFMIAPLLCMVGVFATLAVVPFSSGFILSDLNIGIFYLVGVSSLVGVGVFLGGYASNSKWSMLGGMRGAAQIISYEVPVTLCILSIVLMAGGLSMTTLVEGQGGLPHQWYIFHNPFTFIGFFVFFIGILAETNRAPFDLPEAESELVSGYHTEYSGMSFAFFALAEYVEVFVVCGVAAALYLGGYKVPFDLGNGVLISEITGAPAIVSNGIGQLLQIGSFFTKTFALYYVVIWVRWTLPRLRVDHLVALCWKYLTPICIFNLIAIATWMWAFEGHSVYELLMTWLHSLGGGGGH
ncbi:NADH-quinone oxidoreductase subunit H [Halobacteriovorax marinus]|uniref:NADH-quinone oxidoreductase subunit NuoH n=1 Tax=Halobacteriovorax marinus TaxID=97084 RepID=UPI000BC34B37|nr:NADH-quinone oxidoreductase subunit NuoH [Halobacteriovorax marinus]ATH06404.1 NADH-quinone oxidoreductase subunit H [Halobacteriovorax marinus]